MIKKKIGKSKLCKFIVSIDTLTFTMITSLYECTNNTRAMGERRNNCIKPYKTV